jgi:hypothetical protein
MYENLTLKELIQKKQSIYKDEDLSISYIDNNADSVVIVFAFAMYRPRKPVESLPFYTKTDKNVIHIVDINVSFFNNFTAEFVIDQIKHLIKDKDIYLVGLSLGAFNAIYFSNFVKAKRCLAFGPQYSLKNPDPDRYRGDFKFFVDGIKNMKHDTIQFSEDTEYVVVLGGDEEEKISSHQTIKQSRERNINAFFVVFDEAPHLILDYLNKDSGPIDCIVEGFLHDSQDIIKQKYSSYPAQFFRASDDYNYS